MDKSLIWSKHPHMPKTIPIELASSGWSNNPIWAYLFTDGDLGTPKIRDSPGCNDILQVITRIPFLTHSSTVPQKIFRHQKHHVIWPLIAYLTKMIVKYVLRCLGPSWSIHVHPIPVLSPRTHLWSILTHGLLPASIESIRLHIFSDGFRSSNANNVHARLANALATTAAL